MVRAAVLSWVKDVKKHLSLPRVPTGREKHRPQSCTWAAGSMVAALPAGAGAGVQVQGDGEGGDPGRGLHKSLLRRAHLASAEVIAS